MCGIAGMLLAPGKSVESQKLDKMGQTLSHRGPDNFGCLVEENYGVAHTRLSILDLSEAGNQPFCNERYSLIYNGEIYNFLELREPLIEEGVNLKSQSDTEVLFYHLIIFGVEATLPKLNGMFAFSFFDSEENVLYVCRDRLGIKPISYLYRNDDFYWASEIKALAKICNLEIDPIRLLMSTNLLFDGRNNSTVFHNVKNVPAGSYLIVKPGEEPIQKSYFDLSDEISEDYYNELNKLTMEEAVNRFGELLDKSMKGMLLSDAPMGVFASGGVDSSLIAAVAFKQKPELSLFTANVLGKYSEVEEARLLSRSIGTKLYEAEYGQNDVLSRWAQATWYYEAPIIAHFNALPLGDVAALARNTKVKAVLTGEGSDELFLGYDIPVARRYDKLKMPVEFLKSLYGLVPMVRRHLFPKESSNMFSFFPKMVSNFEEERIREKYEERYSFVPDSQRPDHITTAILVKFHLASLLHRNDRMGMMAGIESRFPFLDNEIVRFGMNLPIKFKIQPVPKIHNRKHPFLYDKAIVRHLCSGKIPDEILNKEKIGFPTYELQSLVIDREFFDGGYLEDMLEITESGKDELLSPKHRYFAAKLASAEVFGRLFSHGDTIEDITEHLERYVKVDTSINSKVSNT